MAERIYGLSLHHLTAIIAVAERDLTDVVEQVTDPGSKQDGLETIARLRELQQLAAGVCPQQLFCNLVLPDDDAFARVMAKKKV